MTYIKNSGWKNLEVIPTVQNHAPVGLRISMRLKDLLPYLGAIGVSANVCKEYSGGTKVQLPCPLAKWFHKGGCDNRPSAVIFLGDGSKSTSWYCFACKEGGLIYTLIESYAALQSDPKRSGELLRLSHELLKLDKPSLLSRLMGISSRDFLFPPPTSKPCLSQSILSNFMKFNESSLAIEYLRSREIDTEAGYRYGLLFDPRSERIVFPIYEDSKLRGLVGRVISHSGKEKYYNYLQLKIGNYLGGWDQAKNFKKVMIVEGFFDLLKIYSWSESLGIGVVCSFGSNLTNAQKDIILSHDIGIIIGYDNDESGERGSRNAIEELRKYTTGTKRVIWPKGKDPGSLSKEEFFLVMNSSL